MFGKNITEATGEVPLIGNSYNLIDDGCIPGASFRNLEYAEKENVLIK